MQIIKMYASNQRLWRYTSGIITEDSILKFEFVFKTPDWDAVETKTVVFSYRGQNYEMTLDENNQCDVRKEALYAPYFKVSVYGGGIITNTVVIPVEAKSNNEYNQLLDMLQSKSDAEHKHDERYYTENEAEDRFISEDELVQPDWQQPYMDMPGFIKNRTHYEYKNEDFSSDILEEPTVGLHLIKDLSGMPQSMLSYYYSTYSLNTFNITYYYKLCFYGKAFSKWQDLERGLWVKNNNVQSIDAANSKMDVNAKKGIYMYIIIDKSLLSDEDAIKFPKHGIYIEVTDATASDFIKNISLVQMSLKRLDKRYLPNDTAYLSDIDSRINKALVDSIPDWNQNDESASDYIKNRTHYTETNRQLVTSGSWTVTLDGGTDLFIVSKTGLNVESFIIGDIYELICIHNNGNTYKFKLKATQTDEIRARIIHSYGKTEQIDPSGADLAIQIIDGSLSINTAAECNYLTGESSVEVYHIQENIHQIDSKYLPGKQIHIINTNDNMTSIDLTELESGLYYLDNSIEIPVLRQQDGEDVTYDYYYLESNSIISVSNFDSCGYIVSFMYCYTYEWECDDSGNRVFLYAYANDGFGGEDADKIIGRQGTGNNAEIFNDYEENEAIGNYSHVEGYKGFGSGFAAHVEGDCCYASGPGSHAEGVGTMAEASAQHVQGQFNIPDENWAYAHIVGNGFNDSERSNAHTLDWSGNAWFAGDIKIGGSGQDDVTAKTIATKDDVDTLKPKSATITLFAADWIGETSPYSQVVTIDGITENSKIDLQPTPIQLSELQNKGTALMVVNDDGIATAYALNYKPTKDYEMQVSIIETIK